MLNRLLFPEVMSEPLPMPESDVFVDIRMWRVGVVQQFLDPFGPTTVGGSMFQEQATNGKNRCCSVVIAMQLYGWLTWKQLSRGTPTG